MWSTNPSRQAQRQVGVHTKSFKAALRAALREDPDIILVGEMRDLETVSIAIETAETGHLVFGTLHTTTASGTVDRIIDQFPADRQEQIRVEFGKKYFVNAGSVGQPRDGDWRAAYCIYHADESLIEQCRARYDIETARKKIVSAGLPRLLADRLALGR